MASVSQAKNLITKTLHDILDSPPGDGVTRDLWAHFESSCAFCSAHLNREARQGHRDHLMPRSIGGSNHPANLVLSCASCNGDERREAEWAAFLGHKCGDDSSEYAQRHRRILSWVDAHGGSAFQQNDSLQRIVEHCREPVFVALDAAAEHLRSVREGADRPTSSRIRSGSSALSWIRRQTPLRSRRGLPGSLPGRRRG